MLYLSPILLYTGLGLILYLFYRWATSKNDFFIQQNIPALKPLFLFGNTGSVFTKRLGLIEFITQLYNSFPNAKICGFFNFMTPTYFIRDPELFKQISIKDFESFEDHKFFVDPEMDSLLGNTVFLMRGNTWRDMRTTLSPTFTGSKMRQMFELIRESAIEATTHLHNEAMKRDRYWINTKDVYIKCMTDAIASCAFGLKINSLKDEDNVFYQAGLEIQKFASLKTFLKMIFFRALPWLAKLLEIEIVGKKTRETFSDVILKNIEERRERNISRPDMIDLLLHTKAQNADSSTKETKFKQWSDIEMIAQNFVFFWAGMDTTTWVLIAATYELALHKDIQQGLIQEIDETAKLLNGKHITYDDVKKMKYLDAVVSEVLRLHSPAVFVDRVCTKDCVLDCGDNMKVEFKKGDALWIPIYSFHHNPEYFPDPERFDPERFNDENKRNINPAHYIPFGSGPRFCLGNRFALMEIKAMIYFLLSKFTFEVTPKTPIPIKIESTPFGLKPKTDVILELKPRHI